MLGREGISIDDLDEQNKTCSVGIDYDEDYYDSIQYNYFQNSNLSAWKVWYCLDNDKSRFAWADDRLILHEIMISGSPQDYIRTPESDLTIDGVKYYAWVWSSSPEFTLSETPKHGDAVYQNFGGMQEIGECDKVFTNGRGVVYRLIDEWGNDVPYDFKNIQFVRPMADGYYDPDGEDTWCYTFTNYIYSAEDGSVLQPDSEGFLVKTAQCNIITPLEDPTLNDIVSFISSNCKLYVCGYMTLNNCNRVGMYACSDYFTDESDAIYINNKKVLTEE